MRWMASPSNLALDTMSALALAVGCRDANGEKRAVPTLRQSTDKEITREPACLFWLVFGALLRRVLIEVTHLHGGRE